MAVVAGSHSVGGAYPRCGSNSQKCWECSQNVNGMDCIAFKAYSLGAAVFWAITGIVLFMLLQLMVDKRLLALQQAIEDPALKTGLTGFALFAIGIMIVGGALRLRLTHPYEYGMATLTGPLGLYAAIPIVLEFFAN